MDLFDRVETPQQTSEHSVAFVELAEKSPNAFKTISEVSDMLGVPQHVLRFWESKFPQIKPMKRNGGRRYYRPQDVDTLTTIKNLLYKEGYTIKGARKAFNLKKLEGGQEATLEMEVDEGRVADDTGLFEEAAQIDAEHREAIDQMIANLTGIKRAELSVIRGELLELRQMLSSVV